ncbi:hypothetical protein [Aureimonas mangrovi]|uniref:hypothetical protein n=1 Tax=Aureimonas mangrovi TaxID=2758041 RepID=UPI00163D84A0|nr:hypothetical protein [Aureimonas mangrovi]
MTDLPLSERLRKADADTLREMLREAELHLASQQTVALAADQRAMTLVGFMSAAIVVLIGASASFIVGQEQHRLLGVICLWVAAGLMTSVLLALRTAAPSAFDFAGSSPSDWASDVAQGVSLEHALADQCANHAEAIADNHDRMKINGARLWSALRVGVGTILAGGVAFVLALAFA